MPTGYTYNVAEGKINKLSEYMVETIYAMDVMVMYRDVPTHQRPSFNENSEVRHFDLGESEITRIQEKITDLIDQANRLMSMDEMQTNAAYIEHLKRDLKYQREREAMAAATHLNYEHMIKQVEAWKPGGTYLDGLKDFMLQQLYTSAQHDIRPEQISEYKTILPSDPETWRADSLRSLRGDLKYYADELEKTKTRIQEREHMLQAFPIEYKTQLKLEKQNP